LTFGTHLAANSASECRLQNSSGWAGCHKSIAQLGE
jgi:hypothetical protein